MGKSGLIGRKIAATLASTGTPAYFLHPAEGVHGDIGMMAREDVVLALSNSGETDEVLAVLPAIKRLGVPLILLTGSPGSTLGAAGRRGPGRRRHGGGMPHEPRADLEHDGRPRDG